jgi:transposase
MENKDATIVQLNQTIVQLNQTIVQLNEVILDLKKIIDNLSQEIVQLKKENTDLKELLRLNSQNSSKPPSSDRYPKKEPKTQPKDRPKREGFARKLFAKEDITEFKQYFPKRCDKCGSSNFLPRSTIVEVRQTVEIPPVKPIVTEHQAYACRCKDCGKKVRAFLPHNVTTSAFGPKIKALSSTLSGKFHLSKRHVRELFKILFNIDISLGSIVNIESQASAILKEPYEEALKILRRSQVCYADETGWKTKGQPKWLWQATDKQIVLFKLFSSRGRRSFQSFLGKDCTQNLVTDRFRAYSTLGLHQYCWAHLKRDFRRIEQRDGLVSWIGKLMGSLCNLLFKWSHEKERNTLREQEFKERCKSLKEDFHYLFKLGLRIDTQDSKLGKTGRFCERLLFEENKLWAFIEEPILDLTNNLSERNLRPAVLWRKSSFGNQSSKGEQFVERILSAIETLKIQKRNILGYLTHCFKANSQLLPIPSFIGIN